ncbi:agmatinase [Oscillibacter sp. MSJ-2]|uniref:Agmatinase n=1 Tax=Dysosmobacter acutus TaxID=2841504 RepID=A0ABS6FCJ5_9FIRM|nr:agmatinase [Dysosmobacter acutus]MBU5627115.1 agmatinase [Dysosmobacter acutus]
METRQLIQDPALWAGLNRPGLALEDADVVIFGVPYDGAVQFRSGARNAPKALREITYTISPTTEDLECFSDLNILDLGDVDCGDHNAFFRQVEEIACTCARNGKFFLMIGGDHSTTIPVQRGLDRGLSEDFGIIHIDAHFDLCNDQNGNLLSHGSTERRAIELEHVKGIDSLFFVGIRSLELDEVDFYRENPVHVLTSKNIRALGWEESARRIVEKMRGHKHVYITLDIDCLDPGYAAGTGTPQFGGMDPRELLNILGCLYAQLPVVGMDVVEVAPDLDPALCSLFAARKIVTECMGHWYRKSRGFH